MQPYDSGACKTVVGITALIANGNRDWSIQQKYEWYLWTSSGSIPKNVISYSISRHMAVCCAAQKAGTLHPSVYLQEEH